MDKWAENNKDIDLFGQIGPGKIRPKNFAVTDFMEHQKFDEVFLNADLIVSHAGMGNILKALENGKRIIIFPRKAELGEHRNDHQIGTTRMFVDKPLIYVASEREKLHSLLDELVLEPIAHERHELNYPAELISTICDFIDKR